MKDTYRQCELIQTTPVGFRRYITWLPTEEVKLNRVIRIDGIYGSWKIVSAGQPRERGFIKHANGEPTIVETINLKNNAR